MPYKNIKTRNKIVTMPLLAKESLSLYCDLSVWTKMAIQPIFVMTSVKLKYSFLYDKTVMCMVILLKSSQCRKENAYISKKILKSVFTYIDS